MVFNRLNAAGDKSAAVVIYLNLQRDFHYTDCRRVKTNLKPYTYSKYYNQPASLRKSSRVFSFHFIDSMDSQVLYAENNIISVHVCTCCAVPFLAIPTM